MRTLRKQIHIVNKTNNEERINVKVNEYVAKMQSKGWELYQVFSGDNYLKYTATVIMTK